MSHYDNSAYNSQHINKQPRAQKRGFLEKMLRSGTVLPFSKANKTICIPAVGKHSPSFINKAMADSSDSKLPFYWDEKQLSVESLSPLSGVVVFFVGFSKVVALIMVPFAYVTTIPFSLFDGEWAGSLEFIIIVALYVHLPCLCIWLFFEKIVDKGYIKLGFLRTRKLFDLDRQSGMARLYRSNNSLFFEHPFVEFDCVFNSTPNQQGFLNYGLYLIHRYKNYKRGIPLKLVLNEDSLDHRDYQHLWNMIQRYMDTSQPMPDIITLEAFRHKDPVTAAYDKKTGRDSHYWRNMSDEQYSKELEKIEEKQKDQAVTGQALELFE